MSKLKNVKYDVSAAGYHMQKGSVRRLVSKGIFSFVNCIFVVHIFMVTR